MLISTLFALPLAALATLSAANPLTSRQATGNPPFELTLHGGRSGNYDINYLQTFAVSYANSSAYIGQIKYQTYAEPLLLTGGSGGLTFLSYHSSPTGWQQMYIVPFQTQPVGFSVPHGGAPAGVSTSGFFFNRFGNLVHNGRNNFWACQDAEQAAMNTYQIWWFGAGRPNGVSCQGPLFLQQGPTCPAATV